MITVDGAALKSIREKIRFESSEVPIEKKAGVGTQQWLIDRIDEKFGFELSLRTIINMEKGQASQKTLLAACDVLGIQNWKDYVVNYGQEYVRCAAEKYIDFRPLTSPNKQPDTFMNSVLLMTLDSITLLTESECGDLDSFSLKEIRANLKGLEKTIPFSWHAEVSLTEGQKGWLGWVKEVETIDLMPGDKPLNITVMFRQDNSRVSWQEFVTMVEGSDKARLIVELEFEFSRFTKKLDISVCLDCLKGWFEQGRLKYQADWPHRVQLKTIYEES